MKICYCDDITWPWGSVLDLRPVELKFRILNLEGNVIWFILTYSQEGLMAQLSLYVHKNGLNLLTYTWKI